MPASVPALFAPNPASHLVWWVAGVIGVVLLVALADDLVAWLRRAPKPKRRGVEGAEPGDLRVEEPESQLRRRFFRRVLPVRRTWGG